MQIIQRESLSKIEELLQNWFFLRALKKLLQEEWFDDIDKKKLEEKDLDYIDGCLYSLFWEADEETKKQRKEKLYSYSADSYNLYRHKTGKQYGNGIINDYRLLLDSVIDHISNSNSPVSEIKERTTSSVREATSVDSNLKDKVEKHGDIERLAQLDTILARLAEDGLELTSKNIAQLPKKRTHVWDSLLGNELENRKIAKVLSLYLVERIKNANLNIHDNLEGVWELSDKLALFLKDHPGIVEYLFTENKAEIDKILYDKAIDKYKSRDGEDGVIEWRKDTYRRLTWSFDRFLHRLKLQAIELMKQERVEIPIAFMQRMGSTLSYSSSGYNNDTPPTNRYVECIQDCLKRNPNNKSRQKLLNMYLSELTVTNMSDDGWRGANSHHYKYILNFLEEIQSTQDETEIWKDTLDGWYDTICRIVIGKYDGDSYWIIDKLIGDIAAKIADYDFKKSLNMMQKLEKAEYLGLVSKLKFWYHIYDSHEKEADIRSQSIRAILATNDSITEIKWYDKEEFEIGSKIVALLHSEWFSQEAIILAKKFLAAEYHSFDIARIDILAALALVSPEEALIEIEKETTVTISPWHYAVFGENIWSNNPDKFDDFLILLQRKESEWKNNEKLKDVVTMISASPLRPALVSEGEMDASAIRGLNHFVSKYNPHYDSDKKIALLKWFGVKKVQKICDKIEDKSVRDILLNFLEEEQTKK